MLGSRAIPERLFSGLQSGPHPTGRYFCAGIGGRFASSMTKWGRASFGPGTSTRDGSPFRRLKKAVHHLIAIEFSNQRHLDRQDPVSRLESHLRRGTTGSIAPTFIHAMAPPTFPSKFVRSDIPKSRSPA
jgi:hypothetical protein